MSESSNPNYQRARDAYLQMRDMANKSNYQQRPLHELPGYKGPRVLGPYARWVHAGATSRAALGRFGYKPHGGRKEAQRRLKQMAKRGP